MILEDTFDRVDLENMRRVLAAASINGLESARQLVALDRKIEEAIANYDNIPF